VQAAIEEIALSGDPVLITGEVGTGKELAARIIHHRSPRRDGPLITVNCPALPGEALGKEMFGDGEPDGRLSAAAGGTLLLLEIGLMDAAVQERLNGMLEETAGQAARILATTSHDLVAEVAVGAFRQDLRDRLGTLGLALPPLRERREDIPFLLRYIGSRPGLSAKMTPEAMDLLLRYDFPGNVEELENILGRARLLTNGPVIQPKDLPEEVRTADARGQSMTTQGFVPGEEKPEEP
jgi:DNA-binding NtrC family response regulator